MRFRTTSILLCLLALATPAFASNPVLPSQGLEQRVDFWKKVYAQYGADDVIIHDRVWVNLIYDVATEATQKAKVADIENALREIRLNLETPATLSPTATSVLNSIVAQGITVTAAQIDDLSTNVHTQNGIKERFRDGIIRSGRYVDKFREIMSAQGVPTELALLPLVESSFQNARSKAGAVGVWQFTSGTGRLYMHVSGKVDDRLDPVRSSEAAAHLLRDNYNALGVWPLAITAYNHGRGGMLQAQKAFGSDLPAIIDGYRGPVFGYASMNFYTEFLAAVEVYENYPQYFGELTLDRPDSPPNAGPVMRASTTKAATTPAKASAPVKTAAASKYKVQNGDTLWDIAKKFGTSIGDLMSMNKLSNPVIHAGEILLVK